MSIYILVITYVVFFYAEIGSELNTDGVRTGPEGEAVVVIANREVEGGTSNKASFHSTAAHAVAVSNTLRDGTSNGGVKGIEENNSGELDNREPGQRRSIISSIR